MKKLLLILLCFPMIGFGQNVNIPDANFKAYLIGEPLINANGDSEIQVSEASSFNGQISCENMNITDLTGIEYFINLTGLYCPYNQITSLNISQNISLTGLSCYDNQLTSLNLNGAISLQFVYSWNNQLVNLDVSQNTSLISLVCNNNQLISLDLSQISCTLQINESDFSENPNLNCIEVTDLSCWQNNFIGFLDTTYQYYSTNCSGVTFISEYTTNKELLKVIDLLGRETKQTNQLLLYIYNDGTVVKKIIIE